MHELVVRCTTDVCPQHEEPEELVARRYLVVVDRDFPRVTRIGQLTETLLYLATQKEYHELMLPEGEEKTKEKFEKFWLRLGETPQAAANLIKQYHARVEEANLLFSDYKEGWKTDRGMVYVVFGSPPLIERQYRTERWTYSSGALFIYERLIEQRSDLPFENWELVRDASHEWYWEKERDRWRRGQIF
jgi:GWxTD domain-containing protein